MPPPADLLGEAVPDAAAELGEDEPRLVDGPVDERDDVAVADEDRVRLAHVDELEARAPLGRLAADALAEVEALHRDVRQLLDALDGRATDVEDLEERAAGAVART